MTYKIPKGAAPATLYGGRVEGNYTVSEYLEDRGLAFLGDFFAQGLSRRQIENAVNSGEVRVTRCPGKREGNEVYFLNGDEKALKRLERIETRGWPFVVTPSKKHTAKKRRPSFNDSPKTSGTQRTSLEDLVIGSYLPEELYIRFM